MKKKILSCKRRKSTFLIHVVTIKYTHYIYNIYIYMDYSIYTCIYDVYILIGLQRRGTKCLLLERRLKNVSEKRSTKLVQFGRQWCGHGNICKGMELLKRMLYLRNCKLFSMTRTAVFNTNFIYKCYIIYKFIINTNQNHLWGFFNVHLPRYHSKIF